MNEVELALKSASEILKSLSRGASKLADTINTLSNSLKEEPAKTPAKTTIVKTRKKAVTTSQSNPSSNQSGRMTAADKVYDLIESSSDGVDTYTLMEKSGFDRKKVQNIIFKLKKLRKIKIKERGIYVVS